MHFTLHTKAVAICYAILSLPYVALALDFEAPKAYAHHARNFRTFAARSDSVSEWQPSLLQATGPSVGKVVVNSTTVRPNIPVEDQEVFYFRNFTMVGKKSEGFDIKQWELDRNYPDRSHWTPEELMAAGDGTLTRIFAGIVIAGGLAAACVALSSKCATYIGTNIGKFIQAVGSHGGEAAVTLINTASGNPPQGLPTPGGGTTRKRNYQLHEEFGCYYDPPYSGVCQQDTASTAFYNVVQEDGDYDVPHATCYSYATGGKTIGYFSHCFAGNENCNLQCGSKGPDDNASVHDISDP